PASRTLLYRSIQLPPIEKPALPIGLKQSFVNADGWRFQVVRDNPAIQCCDTAAEIVIRICAPRPQTPRLGFDLPRFLDPRRRESIVLQQSMRHPQRGILKRILSQIERLPGPFQM